MLRISLRVLIMLGTVVAQKSNIERININSMQNGVTINIVSDIKIQRSQITGWHNPSTSWSYITIYNTVGNTDALNKSDLDEGITDLEIIQLDESLQIGIRTISSIEGFEFYHGSDNIMTASLRYPIDQTLVFIDKKEVDKKTKWGVAKKILSEFNTIFTLISAIVLINIIIN